LVLRLVLLGWLVGQAVYTVIQAHGALPLTALAFSGLWMVFEVSSFLRWRRLPRNLAHAEDLHRSYLGGLGYAIPDAAAEEAPTTSAPAKREIRWSLYLAVALVCATIVFAWLLSTLAVMSPHSHSPWRLIVGTTVCLLALALCVAAAVLTARAWKRQKGVRAHLEVALLLVIDIAFTVGWTIGLIDVLFLGA
jgi:hypothetical protein